MNAKIDDMNAKIDHQNAKVDAKFDVMNAKIDAMSAEGTKQGKDMIAMSIDVKEVLQAQGAPFERSVRASLAHYLHHPDGNPLLAYEQEVVHFALSGDGGTVEPLLPLRDRKKSSEISDKWKDACLNAFIMNWLGRSTKLRNFQCDCVVASMRSRDASRPAEC